MLSNASCSLWFPALEMNVIQRNGGRGSHTAFAAAHLIERVVLFAPNRFRQLERVALEEILHQRIGRRRDDKLIAWI